LGIGSSTATKDTVIGRNFGMVILGVASSHISTPHDASPNLNPYDETKLVFEQPKASSLARQRALEKILVQNLPNNGVPHRSRRYWAGMMTLKIFLIRNCEYRMEVIQDRLEVIRNKREQRKRENREQERTENRREQRAETRARSERRSFNQKEERWVFIESDIQRLPKKMLKENMLEKGASYVFKY
jgi:hypothetical protein